MENHPHDSICGCSIDQVHDEMKVRFDQVEQIGEEVTRQSLESLAQSVNTPNLPAIIVFNPTSATRTDMMEAVVESPAPFDLLDSQGFPIPYQTFGLGSQELIHLTLKPKELQALYVAVHDGQVMNISIQDLKIKREGGEVTLDVVVTEHGTPNLIIFKERVAEIETLIADATVETFHIRARSADKTRIIFTADVPGLGWQTYRLRPRPAEAKVPVKVFQALHPLLSLILRPRHSKPPYRVENDLLAVEAMKDGTLIVTDKVSGGTYRGLNRFVDGADCGDEYNYCPPVSDRVTSARLKGVTITCSPVQQTLHLDLELPTPVGLAPDRKSRSKETLVTRLSSHVTLARGVPRVDIRTEVENQAKDHRLRVHFPAPFDAEAGQYDGHFEVVKRSIGVPAFDEIWVEQPRPEVPQRAFASVTNGALGLTVANRGLPEVEVLKNAQGNAEISITLLRCVGWLSRDDFTNRKGHAGPFMETPGAQMPGKWVFDYSIIPHVERDPIPSYHQAYAFEAPLRAVCTDAHPGSLPPSGSFVAVTPDEFVVSAVKQTENGKGWLVRGYNITGEEIAVKFMPWQLYNLVERVDLAENRQSDLKPAADGSVTITVKGHEIVSVIFRE
jgi:hypothetical protein